MEVTYSLEPDDLWRLQKYIKSHNQSRLLLFAKMMLLAIALGGYFWDAWIADPTPRAFSNLIGALERLLAPLLLIVPLYVVRSKIVRTQQAKALQALNPRTVRIVPEHLYCRVSSDEFIFPWSILVGIVDAGDYIYLFVTKKMAYIVPKRAFANEAQAREFFLQAVDYLDAAIQSPPIPAPPKRYD